MTLLVHLHRRRRCRHAKATEADFAVRKDLGPVVGKVNNAIQLINTMITQWFSQYLSAE